MKLSRCVDFVPHKITLLHFKNNIRRKQGTFNFSCQSYNNNILWPISFTLHASQNKSEYPKRSLTSGTMKWTTTGSVHCVKYVFVHMLFFCCNTCLFCTPFDRVDTTALTSFNFNFIFVFLKGTWLNLRSLIFTLSYRMQSLCKNAFDWIGLSSNVLQR